VNGPAADLEPALVTSTVPGPSLTMPRLRRWLPALVRRWPNLVTAYAVPGRLAPRTREAGMLGVTSINRCAACQAVHGRWGRAVGLDTERLAVDEAAAFAFGQQLAIAGPGGATPPASLSPRHRRELEAVALAMELANLAGNRAAALRSRRTRSVAGATRTAPARSAARRALDETGARGLDLVMAVLDRLGVLQARHRIAAQAHGEVLEIGIGSGRNLHVYPADAKVHGIDPSAAVLAMARARGRALGREPALTIGDAGRLPFPDASFDTVVATFVLCSVDDVDATLREARRVLRPGGTVRLLEHARSRHSRLARAQRALAPAWARAAGGCRLDHDVRESVRAAGFRVISERGRAGGILVEQVVTA
jgi:AhpD family alkylhydroperoxidase